ncbi:hypothetical protein HHK36_004401 [Tetracentron sinense]|uniref:Uncharacterized protein n=1 Tax=Tetracentron sinense TaxID=13715 RepID=A0A835DTE8_TETSI|nr:hypothetical protein HHK36_004401 [Tetracentron sinense]
MARKPFSNSLLLFSSILACFFPSTFASQGVERDGVEVSGMFVFGSSVVDNGNNNFLANSMAKADYLPYGIDFPLGPSGRFTNGKNVIDLLGQLLKLPSSIPVFADPMTRGKKIIHGVNFASGASGILDETGSVAGRVISLNEQIRNFEKVTLPDIEGQLGSSSTKSSLSDYLFVLGTGSNDYTLNYFIQTGTSNVSLQAFTNKLAATFSRKLKRLYHLGGRKFVLISINPIGCTPVSKANSPSKHCREDLNGAALLFNAHLKVLVDVMKPQMPGSNLVYVNSYGIIRDIINKPFSQGFQDTSNACCEVVLRNEGGNGISCKRNGYVCADRTTQVFFDGLHLTEAVNSLIATKAYASNFSTEVYPINVKQLAEL